jgi:hypothetical protein
VQPCAGAADADALVGLDAGALALDDLDVDDHRVARAKVRDVLAGAKFFDLLAVDLLQ